MIESRVIEVDGIVQGVGFRPYVHRLATARALEGFVRNDSRGLLINVQGSPEVLDDFVTALSASPPPLASIGEIRTTNVAVSPLRGFSIIDADPGDADFGRDTARSGSGGAPAARTLVSPDAATCADCLGELWDPGDRRHLYPFINCTHCGPRFTIVTDLPFDRASTTMASFEMCQRCRDEYENPADRRFHAQAIACPDCGPAMRLVDMRGLRPFEDGDPVAGAAAALIRGDIVAVKGLGGFHIACDAANAEAVRTLRLRKRREARPFAMMVRDAEAASALCEMNAAELALLESRERPIVLMRRRSTRCSRQGEPETGIAIDDVAPGADRLGLMLPYTPLHHLLMRAVARPVVMTSGNLADDPIAFENADAIARLGSVADAILIHDRPIATRCDDSVMLVAAGRPAFVRRSRGFTPRAIKTAIPFSEPVLGVGGQLKNTFCLARGKSAFVSHHVGDLGSAASYAGLRTEIRHFAALMGVEPSVVAHDLHPDYPSTRLAGEMQCDRLAAVQHHHAHVASCMAEHGVSEPVIGVAFDGAGLGDDGAVWGGEFLVVDATGYRRAGHLGYVPLPGGDAGARRPRRMAMAHLWNAFGPDVRKWHRQVLGQAANGESKLVCQMLEKNINSPPTSSVGRLFDAVASLTGVRDVSEFEGQAAMELEAIADGEARGGYPTDISEQNSVIVCDPGSIIRAVVEDVSAGVSQADISAAFHNGLAGMIRDVALRIRDSSGINRIALTGGVFQNVLMVTRSVAFLESAGFEVLTHRLVPCNDGGLSLGQVYVVALGGRDN